MDGADFYFRGRNRPLCYSLSVRKTAALRACYEITAPFMLVLLLANFVKKPRRSSAMPVFFASLPNKITSPDSENLFLNKPLVR